MVPRSHTITLGLPLARHFSAELRITDAAQNCPFLMLITLPVLAAATSKSVCSSAPTATPPSATPQRTYSLCEAYEA
jgi:hypothetical protein